MAVRRFGQWLLCDRFRFRRQDAGSTLKTYGQRPSRTGTISGLSEVRNRQRPLRQDGDASLRTELLQAGAEFRADVVAGR
jgi:hypothetical protein